ncbi:MAG: prolipoprotein diacylglyceryl transferase [Fidelibacterota bacterium]
MYPILFKIGSFSVPTVGLFHATAFLVGSWWTVREARRVGMEAQKVLDFLFVIIVWSVIGARIFSVLFDGNLRFYLHNPHEILMVWKGGLTFYGGFLFGLTAGVWYASHHNLSKWEIADVVAPAVALGAAVGRLGCFASGDSFGKPTGLPWGVIFGNPMALAPTGIALHPTQIYSVITNLAVLGMLLWWRKRQQFKGELFLVFVILYAITRSVVEVFRNDPRGVYLDGLISTSQIISIVAGTAAVILYVSRRAKFTRKLPGW